MEKDSFMFGFVVAATVPVLAFLGIQWIFEFLTSANIFDSAGGMGMGNRMRTMYLLSICCNLIPFQYFKRQRWDEAMRGVVFPTLIYVGFWVYKYYNIIFSGL